MAVTTPAPISRVYPRACGGTIPSPLQVATRSGLSPRLRGNQGPGQVVGFLPGSIPALAGEPPTRLRQPIGGKVYPRACGGTLETQLAAQSAEGLSPRLRGNQVQGIGHHVGNRSIPALAGEPARKIAALGPIKVYPRACGGTRRGSRGGGSRWGLSPRLRGNQDHNRRHYQQNGSIPALAGEPDIMLPSPVTSTVYPRACGGTVSWSCSS